MNNLAPLLILFAISDKSGFESIKNAINAADSFTEKIGNLQNVMKFLPGIMSGISANEHSEQFVDTLKDVLEKIS